MTSLRGACMRFCRVVSIIASLIALTAGIAQAFPKKSPPVSTAAKSILSEDKGKFRIMVNGQEAGKEEFEISSGRDGWTVHGVTEIQGAQSATHVTGTIRLQADGTPVSYEWSTQGQKKASANIQFQGVTATVQLHVGDSQPFAQEFTFQSPRIVVLDNNLYEQYAVLAALYDWDKKGSQTFSVFVPQSMTPGDVTVEWAGTETVGDKRMDHLRVRTEDLELNLFLDGGKLMRIAVPSANAEIIRE